MSAKTTLAILFGLALLDNSPSKSHEPENVFVTILKVLFVLSLNILLWGGLAYGGYVLLKRVVGI